jgi:hypothetical protein
VAEVCHAIGRGELPSAVRKRLERALARRAQGSAARPD